MKRVFYLALMSVLLLGSARESGAQASFTGKETAYSFVPYVALPPVGPATSLTLLKGKSKTVVVLTCMLSNRGNVQSSGIRIDAPSANGHTMIAGEGAYDTVDPNFGASATGTWFVDIDDFEASFPGEFRGVPIVIDVVAGEVLGASRPGALSCTVRTDRKK